MKARTSSLVTLDPLSAKGDDVGLEAKCLVRERPDGYDLGNKSALILRSCRCNVQQIESGARSPSCLTAHISCFAKLLTPAFDRLPPNHHVINDLLALPLHPLFRGPRGRDSDRQQEYRAEEGDSNILRCRPRRIDVGSATRTCIVCDRAFSLR
jgi:hypothetical protein